MTNDVTAGTDILFEQAPMTAADYMRKGRDEIDEMFGDGYAKKHPNLVAAFMRTAAQDFHTAEMKDAYQDIREKLDDIASALTRHD